MIDNLIPDLLQGLSELQSAAFTPIIVMLVITMVIDISIWIQLATVGVHIRTVLKLLLHFQPEVIYSSPRVMKVLSGDFSPPKSDSMNRDSEFFEDVFRNIPGPAMYANSEMLIKCANAACRRVFGDIPMLGVNLVEFFDSPQFIGNKKPLFESSRRSYSGKKASQTSTWK
jgi:hypothetical protein